MPLEKKAEDDIINLEFQGHKQEFRQQMGGFRNVHCKINLSNLKRKS